MLPAHKIDETSLTSKVVSLYPDTAGTIGYDQGFMDNFVRTILANEIFGNSVKTTVELLIREATIRNEIDKSVHLTDPFDPIYLSKLKPDNISKADVENIRRLFPVKDNSPAIDFNDDLED